MEGTDVIKVVNERPLTAKEMDFAWNVYTGVVSQTVRQHTHEELGSFVVQESVRQQCWDVLTHSQQFKGDGLKCASVLMRILALGNLLKDNNAWLEQPWLNRAVRSAAIMPVLQDGKFDRELFQKAMSAGLEGSNRVQ